MQYGSIIAIAFALAIAGCAGPAGDPTTLSEPQDQGDGNSPTEPQEQDDAKSPTVTKIPVSMIVSAGSRNPIIWSVSLPANNGGPVEVHKDAIAVIVEAKWDCDTPVCKLHMNIMDRSNGHIMAESTGERSITIEILERIEPGSWGVGLHGDGAELNVQGEIRVTQFFAPPPEGYTAF